MDCSTDRNLGLKSSKTHDIEQCPWLPCIDSHGLFNELLFLMIPIAHNEYPLNSLRYLSLFSPVYSLPPLQVQAQRVY